MLKLQIFIINLIKDIKIRKIVKNWKSSSSNKSQYFLYIYYYLHKILYFWLYFEDMIFFKGIIEIQSQDLSGTDIVKTCCLVSSAKFDSVRKDLTISFRSYQNEIKFLIQSDIIIVGSDDDIWSSINVMIFSIIKRTFISLISFKILYKIFYNRLIKDIFNYAIFILMFLPWKRYANAYWSPRSIMTRVYVCFVVIPTYRFLVRERKKDALLYLVTSRYKRILTIG